MLFWLHCNCIAFKHVYFYVIIYLYIYIVYTYTGSKISNFTPLPQELFSMVGLIPGVLKFAHTDCQRSLRQEARSFFRISEVTMWHIRRKWLDMEVSSLLGFSKGFPTYRNRIWRFFFPGKFECFVGGSLMYFSISGHLRAPFEKESCKKKTLGRGRTIYLALVQLIREPWANVWHVIWEIMGHLSLSNS